MRHMTLQQYEEAMAVLDDPSYTCEQVSDKWTSDDIQQRLIDAASILDRRFSNPDEPNRTVMQKYFKEQPVQLLLPLEY